MPIDVEDEIRQLDKRFFRIEVLFGVTIAVAATFGVGGIWLSSKTTEAKKSISEIENTVAEMKRDISNMQGSIDIMQGSIKQMESQSKSAQETLDNKLKEALTKIETTADLLVSRLRKVAEELQNYLDQSAKEYLNRNSEGILRRIKNLEKAKELEREQDNRKRERSRDIPIVH